MEDCYFLYSSICLIAFHSTISTLLQFPITLLSPGVLLIYSTICLYHLRLLCLPPRLYQAILSGKTAKYCICTSSFLSTCMGVMLVILVIIIISFKFIKLSIPKSTKLTLPIFLASYLNFQYRHIYFNKQAKFTRNATIE